MYDASLDPIIRGFSPSVVFDRDLPSLRGLIVSWPVICTLTSFTYEPESVLEFVRFDIPTCLAWPTQSRIFVGALP
jgi:hypothetical protein